MNVKKFVPIETKSIEDKTTTFCDLYCYIGSGDADKSEDFILYAKAPFRWTNQELADLKSAKFNHLYIPKKQLAKWERYQKITTGQFDEVKTDPSNPEHLKNLQKSSALIIESCFVKELDKEAVDYLSNVADEVAESLLIHGPSLNVLEDLATFDTYTYMHCVGVGMLTGSVALEFGISDKETLKRYVLGGVFHDIGKRQTPLEILNKRGPLTKDEWEIMKKHPEDGYQMVKEFIKDDLILDIIRSHHEKIDGSGYLTGLSGDEIGIHIRIATVADIYNALTSTRAYHIKRTPSEALFIMKKSLEGKMDEKVFQALINTLEIRI
jgi:putative nucleotidyltransferase with HDIG domain